MLSVVGVYCESIGGGVLSHLTGESGRLALNSGVMRESGGETLTSVVVSGCHEGTACWNSRHSAAGGRGTLWLMETWTGKRKL